MQEVLSPSNSDRHSGNFNSRVSSLSLSLPVAALVILAIFFLPFTKALTIYVGFPLKIYEVLFVLAFLLFILNFPRLPKKFVSRFLIIILLFWVVALISSSSPLISSTVDANINFRGGASVDAGMRVCYLAFNIAVFVMVYYVASRYRNWVIDFWLYGMAVAASYGLYSFLSFNILGDAYLLPGLERHQMGYIDTLLVPRSGTFEEGNFAGLYFMSSLAIAVWASRYWFALLALSGVVLSLSTSAVLGLVIFASMYIALGRIGIFKKAAFVLLPSVIGVISFYYLGFDAKFEEGAGASGSVRLNEAMTGLEIFSANPIFGVGLGQYGFLYSQFEWDSALSIFSSAEKHIPNNVYVELLSETGIVGFLLFLAFWGKWMRSYTATNRQVFLPFGLGMLAVWIAYPTFNITYLWCLAGLGLAIQKIYEDDRLVVNVANTEDRR